MIHLRKLARAHQLSLTALAQQIDAFADQVSPLTRVAITEFLETIAAELLPVADATIDVIIERLLAALDRRRSPLPSIERETLRGVLDVLAGPLKLPVEYLATAINDGRPVVIQHGGDIDSVAGALILHHVLTHYLRHVAQVQDLHAAVPASAFVVTLGRAEPPTSDRLGLAIRDARAIHYSISTQAWRLGQMLLMRYETLRDGTFMIYDLETTSTQELSAEIVEMAAQPFVRGKAIGEAFNRLVKPCGPIPQAASEVHNITWRDVKDAPRIELVLPDFLAYLGDATLVGHNITQFDHKLICRHATLHGLQAPNNELLDTCALAKRVLPNMAHGLEALAQHFGMTGPQTHRAIDDVQMNAEVLHGLLEVHARQQELDVLSEALPLVALGIWASNVARVDENVTLVCAGGRALTVHA
ncbi:MAG: hypothetical protein CYG59_26365, partial [Chloroflexi bacterium]